MQPESLQAKRREKAEEAMVAGKCMVHIRLWPDRPGILTAFCYQDFSALKLLFVTSRFALFPGSQNATSTEPYDI